MICFRLIFAIMSVQFFAGRFYKCLDKSNGEPGVRFSEIEVPGKNKCLELKANGANVSWENSVINFDNVGESFKWMFHPGNNNIFIKIYSNKTFILLFTRKCLSLATPNRYIQRLDGNYGRRCRYHRGMFNFLLYY